MGTTTYQKDNNHTQVFARIVTADGSDVNGVSYQLASAQNLTAGSTTTPQTAIVDGSYIWNVAGATFGGGSLILESLGSDGVSWQTTQTATANGSLGLTLGANATVRIRNPGAGSITNIYSNLS